MRQDAGDWHDDLPVPANNGDDGWHDDGWHDDRMVSNGNGCYCPESGKSGKTKGGNYYEDYSFYSKGGKTKGRMLKEGRKLGCNCGKSAHLGEPNHARSISPVEIIHMGCTKLTAGIRRQMLMAGTLPTITTIDGAQPMMDGTHLLRLSVRHQHQREHHHLQPVVNREFGIDPIISGSRAPTAMTSMTRRLFTTV